MLGFVKLTALSAVLSYGVVNAMNVAHDTSAQSGSAKLYYDRVLPEGGPSAAAPGAVPQQAARSEGAVSAAGRKADRRQSARTECAAETWPYLSSACLTRSDGASAPSRVRVIPVEHRAVPTASALAHLPQTDAAGH